MIIGIFGNEKPGDLSLEPLASVGLRTPILIISSSFFAEADFPSVESEGDNLKSIGLTSPSNADIGEVLRSVEPGQSDRSPNAGASSDMLHDN